MNVVAAILTQLLHVALMLAIAPVLAGFLARTEAAFGRRKGPPVLQPWRDLKRLLRKQPVRVESASVVSRHGALLGVAAVTAAVCLVPSFTLGMAFAPLADLIAIVGLLGIMRVTSALMLLDPGSAPAGVAAARSMRLALFGDTALLLGVFTLSALAGTTNLDALAGLQREGLLQPAAASALAATALVAVVIVCSLAREQAEPTGDAPVLALFMAALETLFWLNLISSLFLPIGMAEAEAGPLAWAIGVIAWLLKLAVLTVGLAACRFLIGSQRPRAATELLALAGLLALVAAVFAISGTGAA